MSPRVNSLEIVDGKYRIERALGEEWGRSTKIATWVRGAVSM
jgi:hypothetical protein